MSTLVLPQPRRRAGSRSALRALAQRPELLVLLALAGALNLWALDLNGYANDYYAAAVRSMTQSWHAFLYGSFDAAGLQTVDKPPLALWVQALVRARVRAALVGVAGAAGADGRRDRRAHVRPRAVAVRPPARLRRGPDARADADHGRDLAPQQPGRAAGAVPRRRRVGARPRSAQAGQPAGGSCSAACSSGSGSRRRWPRRCWSCPGLVARVVLGRAEGPRHRRQAAVRGRRGDGRRSGSRGRC